MEKNNCLSGQVGRYMERANTDECVLC